MRGETKQQLQAHPTATLKVRPRSLVWQPSGPPSGLFVYTSRHLTVLILAGGHHTRLTLACGLRAPYAAICLGSHEGTPLQGLTEAATS